MSFCQNVSPRGESFWQKDSLITHILFELWLIMIFRTVANFAQQSLIQKISKASNLVLISSKKSTKIIYGFCPRNYVGRIRKGYLLFRLGNRATLEFLRKLIVCYNYEMIDKFRTWRCLSPSSHNCQFWLQTTNLGCFEWQKYDITDFKRVF